MKQGIITINIQFDPGINTFTLSVENSALYDEIYVENIANYTLKVTTPTVPSYTTATTVTLPFEVSYGDSLEITIVKNDVSESAYMTLKGTLK